MVPKILQLLGSNKKGSVRFEALGGAAKLYIDGPIGWYGVEAGDVKRALDSITASEIEVWINSPGGDVMAARDIHTALRAHPASIKAVVSGLSASAASFLMLAADEIFIAPGAFVMIHNPWTIAVDDAEGLRKTADLLDKVRDTIAADYAKKTGKPVDELLAAMAEETWFTGQEAVDFGLCDSLTEEEIPEDPEDPLMDATSKARVFNLSAYARAPKALTDPAPVPATAIAALHEQNLRRLTFYERTAA